MTSPRTARRLGRILAMLPWVIAHPGASVDDVCSRFGYTRRELIDDLNLVFLCGLPGYGPGDLIDASVEDDLVFVDMADYFDRPLRLTPSEALALLAAGMALISSGQATAALQRAVDKLAAVVVPDGSDALSVQLAEPGDVENLRAAAAAGRVVRITYTALATGRTTERLVEPWSVFSTLGNWYLSGHCRSARAERVFRVDRIRLVEPTDERFEAPDHPPAPEVRYTPGEDDVRAVIRLGPGAGWVAEYYPVEPAGEDTVRFSASDPSVAATLLLRLGPHAELVEGEEVGRALADLRARILARYGDYSQE